MKLLRSRLRNIYASSGYTLQPIEYDRKWTYKPLDDSIIYANPITFAGNELTEEVLHAVYSFYYDVVEDKIENVNLRELKSVQAFVTDRGLNNCSDSNEDVYAVRYEGQLYLMNGNHRVAKAKLNGSSYYRMRVLTVEKVYG